MHAAGASASGNKIQELRRVKFPHSLGALYSTMTGYLGFYPDSRRGQSHGPGPYGTDRYVEQFRQLVRLGPDGIYELDLSWFEHHLTGKHLRLPEVHRYLRPAPPARRQGAIAQHYADIAFALQRTLEETGLHIARWLQRATGLKRICLAGGVALNSVMNGRILLETPFEEFFAPAGLLRRRHGRSAQPSTSASAC